MGRGDNKINRVSLDTLLDTGSALARSRADQPVAREARDEDGRLIQTWIDPMTGAPRNTDDQPTTRVTSANGRVVVEELWENSDGHLDRTGQLPARILYDLDSGQPVAEEHWKDGNRASGPQGFNTTKYTRDPDKVLQRIMHQNLDDESGHELMFAYDDDTPSEVVILAEGSVEKISWINPAGMHRDNGEPAVIEYWENGRPRYVSFARSGRLRNGKFGICEIRYRSDGNLEEVEFDNSGYVLGVSFNPENEEIRYVDGGTLNDDGTVSPSGDDKHYKIPIVDPDQFHAKNILGKEQVGLLTSAHIA